MVKGGARKSIHIYSFDHMAEVFPNHLQSPRNEIEKSIHIDHMAEVFPNHQPPRNEIEKAKNRQNGS
jgi:hypothetical protein